MSNIEVFPVLVLAGGIATRLRPITEKIPKCLVEVAGKPFIIHQLEQLKRQKVTKVFLSIGYLGEMVQSLLGSKYEGIEIEYLYDGPVLLGTAGAIAQALEKLPSVFFVLYGDSYLTVDYSAAQKFFIESGKSALMTVFKNEGLWDTSNIEFDDGKVLLYSKKDLKPEMNYIDYGLSLWKRDCFKDIPKAEPYDLALVMQALVDKGEMAGFEVHERFYEIGSHQGLAELEAKLRSVR